MVEARALCCGQGGGGGVSEQSCVCKEPKARIQTALLDFLTLKQRDRSRLVQ